MKPEIQEWKGWVNGTCSKPVGVSVEAVRPGSAMKGGGAGGEPVTEGDSGWRTHNTVMQTVYCGIVHPKPMSSY